MAPRSYDFSRALTAHEVDLPALVASSSLACPGAAMLPPEALDLGHAAVAIGQFHRHRPRLWRELQIRRRVVRNDTGIAEIARRHFQDLVGYRRIDADAHFA